MEKLIVADYLGNSDAQGIPTGHVLKTLKEAEKILDGEKEALYIVTKKYKEYLKELKILHYVESIDHSCHGFRKIFQTIKKIDNIINVLKYGNNIWFINIDFWFYLAFVFIPIKGKTIYATNYIDYYVGKNLIDKIKLFVYKIGNSKLKCEFTTAQYLRRNNQVYIPDYYFDETVYNRYKKIDKKNQVLFCGGISRAKDIDGVIRTFVENRQPLKIKGQFESNLLHENTCKIATENIEIVNNRFSDEEYYTFLGEFKYVILPYKKENYSGRSSGVILEAIFMDAIVIAPDFLLDQLGVSGIPYKNINELINFNVSKVSDEICNEIITKNTLFKVNYSLKRIKDIYISNIK